jgi:hypothetical protein
MVALMDLDQAGLSFFGAIAIYLASCEKAQDRRWAYIFGLCSQPFWFYSAIESGQWGVFLLSSIYTFSWIRGIWNFWIKPSKLKGHTNG